MWIQEGDGRCDSRVNAEDDRRRYNGIDTRRIERRTRRADILTWNPETVEEITCDESGLEEGN
jgi:hypothetical protein